MFKIAFDPIFAHPLPEGHRFPMVKYELIPLQLRHEGIASEENFFYPDILQQEWVELTHEPEYVHRMKALELSEREMRKIGFPLSRQLVEREFRICQGTLQCAEWALQHGIALNVAGGTHHAYADHGEGFCLLNDFAIAANVLLNRKRVDQVLIIDLDVHQGNGTAALFQNRPEVFTFSMHGRDNYPLHKEKSDLDIELRQFATDTEYLALLTDHLPELLDLVKPDLVFYLSGVDVLETDKLGKLSLSKRGCAQRDEFVFRELYRRNIPVAVAMGGGYSPRIADIVEAHVQTFRAAQNIFL